jgi:hypothetical protein
MKKKKRKKINRRTAQSVARAADISGPERLLVQIGVYMGLFILLNFATVYYFDLQAKKASRAASVAASLTESEKMTGVEYNKKVAELHYRNPELETMKDLKTGGEFEKKLPVFEKMKMTMSEQPVFNGADPIYSLSVCCMKGITKEYYTAKMPWPFITYEYEQGLPTVTVFEINSSKKTGRFDIVVLDDRADMEKLRTVSVRIFTELLKAYMPGYEWRGNVRQEIN